MSALGSFAAFPYCCLRFDVSVFSSVFWSRSLALAFSKRKRNEEEAVDLL